MGKIVLCFAAIRFIIAVPAKENASSTLKGLMDIMKNSGLIAFIALLVAAAGVIIALAAYFKKRRELDVYDDDDDFLFDDDDDLEYYSSDQEGEEHPPRPYDEDEQSF